MPAKAAGAALSIGVGASVGPEDPSVQIGANLGSMLGQWLRLSPDGAVHVSPGKVEIGQGILTALATIAADALEVERGRIRMVPPSTAFMSAFCSELVM